MIINDEELVDWLKKHLTLSVNIRCDKVEVSLKYKPDNSNSIYDESVICIDSDYIDIKGML